MRTIGQVQEAKNVENAKEFGEQVRRQVGDAIGLSPDMLVAVLLKHPIEIRLFVLWQQESTTRMN